MSCFLILTETRVLILLLNNYSILGNLLNFLSLNVLSCKMGIKILLHRAVVRVK